MMVSRTVPLLALTTLLDIYATFLTIRGVVYQHVFDTAMGSPVSVVVANLALENVEERALTAEMSHILTVLRSD